MSSQTKYKQDPPDPNLPEREIDGANFTDINGFYDEISEKLIPGYFWGRKLDAFNDILRGGFGTPKDGFVFVWRNSDMSLQRLGPKTFNVLCDIIARSNGPRAGGNVYLRLE